MPLGYYKTGKSYEEFSEIMKKNKLKYFKQFIEKIDSRGLTINPIIYDYKNKLINALNKLIVSENIDLIVLGSKGRSSSAAVLMGSLTEQLLLSSNIPMIAVKEKGANMRFVDALMNL